MLYILNRSVIGVFSDQILENLQELLIMLPVSYHDTQVSTLKLFLQGSGNYKMYFSNNDMVCYKEYITRDWKSHLL